MQGVQHNHHNHQNRHLNVIDNTIDGAKEKAKNLRTTVEKNMILSITISASVILLLIFCCYLKRKHSRNTTTTVATRREVKQMLANREKRSLNKETQEKKKLFRRKNKKEKGRHDLALDEENALKGNDSMETRGTVDIEADGNDNFETTLSPKQIS